MFKKLNPIYVLTVLLAIASVVGISCLAKNQKERIASNAQKSLASDTSSQLTSKDDWDAGTNNGTVTNNPDGTVTMALPGATIDLLGIYNNDNSRLTATTDDANKTNLIDGDTGTAWTVACFTNGCGASGDWIFHLDQEYNVTRFRLQRQILLGGGYVYTSVNGTDYTLQVTSMGPISDGWMTYNISPAVPANYIKVNVSGGGGPGFWNGSIYELEVTGASPSATHTSAATQITDTNFYQWQTFSPTYTEPANTDISFKFRTSTDSTNWTAWTAAQTVASGGSLDITGLVTSITGDPGEETFYKYIQVETTFTNSDGISTSTLSDYTIGYHTNVKPTTPTPGSVTVGS